MSSFLRMSLPLYIVSQSTWLETLISIASGGVATIYLFISYLRGTAKSPRREIPPPCLRDPELGQHRFVKLNNIKLHYVEAGDPSNPLVILVHGAPDFWFTWRKQIPTLSKDYWVVTLDLRGCGDSDTPILRTQYTTDIIAEDVVSLIHSLGREKAHLVCAGVGGQIGWHIAYHFPEVVTKMVLIHSPHPYVIQKHIGSMWMNYLKVWYMFFLQLPVLPEFVAQVDDGNLIDKLLMPLTKARVVSEQEIEAYKFTFSRREDWTGPLHHLRQIKVTNRDAMLPDVISCPVLLIMGDSDPILSLDTAYKSAEYVERITIKPISGPGYLAHTSHAKTLNHDITEFLKERNPKAPTEEPSLPSLTGLVLGAGLVAVSSTYNRINDVIETTRSLPGNIYDMVQSSIKMAEAAVTVSHPY